MYRSVAAALLLCCLPGLFGCSTIKWMYTDKTTGEMWWIKHSPLSGDEIDYCQPQTGAPVQCAPAELLSMPPTAWAGASKPAAAAAPSPVAAPASHVVSLSYTAIEDR